MLIGVIHIHHLGTKRLQTERLILRPYELSDADDMFANWVTDSEVTHFWSWEPHEHISTTKALLLQWIDEYKNLDNYHWVIVLQTTMQAIGYIYLSEIDNAEGSAEVHYLLSRAYWNQGLMTEACKRVLTFAFDEVGFRTIRSHHHEANLASGRVMQKCGMKLMRTDYRQTGIERLNGNYHYYEIQVRNEGAE